MRFERAGPFLGRDRELAALRSALAGGARLVTLTGGAGLGKTRLALEWCERASGAPTPTPPQGGARNGGNSENERSGEEARASGAPGTARASGAPGTARASGAPEAERASGAPEAARAGVAVVVADL